MGMSPQARNTMLSMLIAMVTHSIINNWIASEDPVDCKPGINDHIWETNYFSRPKYSPSTITPFSTFIKLRDGTKLATDVYMSGSILQYNHSVPVILHLTRHGRAYQVDFPFTMFAEQGDRMNPRTREYVHRFGTFGYAWMVVDVRGSGASYGKRDFDFSEQEIMDGEDILNWILAQSWSNGKVVSYGMGFEGIASLNLAATKHSALKAIVVNGAPFDIYNDALYPGGLKNIPAIHLYSSFSSQSDRQQRWNEIPSFKSRLMMRTFGGNISPMKKDYRSLYEAVAQHQNNPSLENELKSVEYRDDSFHTVSHGNFQQMNAMEHLDAIYESKIPIYAFGGYYDMGVASGTIDAFDYLMSKASEENVNVNDRYRITLGPWSHSGAQNSDPHAHSKTKCFEHLSEIERFFDYHVFDEQKKMANLENEEPIHYLTLIENKWKTTSVWPPLTMNTHVFFLGSNGTLTEDPINTLESGQINYTIDYKASSLKGEVSRWNMMPHIFVSYPNYYHDRASLNEIYLSFTSKTLESMEITGTPEIRLFISIDASDVGLMAYLEDVDYTPPIKGVPKRPGVTYITEGVIRPLHRPISNERKTERTFMKKDGQKLIPHEIYEVVFKMQPISYYLRYGHELRLTIAASDAKDFEIPSNLDLASILTIHYGPETPSSITLPMISRMNNQKTSSTTLLPSEKDVKENEIIVEKDEFEDVETSFEDSKSKDEL